MGIQVGCVSGDSGGVCEWGFRWDVSGDSGGM